MKSCHVFLASLIVLALGGPSVALPGVLLVDASQSEPFANQDGDTWATSYARLQDALDAADDDLGIHTIRVAQGTYRPDLRENHDIGDQFISFELRSLLIEGGYRGIVGLPDDADVRDGVSILSGDLNEDDVPGEFNNSRSDNSVTIVEAPAGLDDTAQLDGFVISGAFSNSSSAMVIDTNSSPTIRGCVFRDNCSINSSAAMFVNGTNQSTIEFCEFYGNVAFSSPALRLSGAGSGTLVRFSTFRDNIATLGAQGGAVLVDGAGDQDSTRVTFQSCQFYNNASRELMEEECPFEEVESCNGGQNGRGGAMSVQNNAQVRLRDCDFDSDFVQKGVGGALHQAGLETIIEASRCTFTNNAAGEPDSGYGDGGAVYLEGSRRVPFFWNTTFVGNHSLGEFASGGGAVFMQCHNDQVKARFMNCLMTNNTSASAGGAVHASCTQAKIVNTTVSRNHADGEGGGLYIFSSPAMEVTNSIVWDNSDDSTETNARQAQIREVNGTQDPPAVVWSCIQDGTIDNDHYPGGGNIDDDPDFADPDGEDDEHGTADDDYRLVPGSDCVDAGSNDGVLEDDGDVDNDNNQDEDTPLDLDRTPRIVFSGSGEVCDGLVDMGAYEHDVHCLLGDHGDMNGDGEKDGLDIQPFVDCFLEVTDPCDCGAGDFALPQGLDTADVPPFVACLLSGGEDCGSDLCAVGGPDRGGLADCNGNEVNDDVDMFLGDSQDCNGNAVPDECDIAECDNDPACGDVNLNGIPDGCEPDCNGNSVPDDADIAGETSEDCNENGIPDECEMAAGGDCDGNEVLDACEAFDDCDEDLIPDACEDDCDGNEIPDDCELEENDCNANGYLDACDLEIPPPLGSFDCNENGVPDECDIAACESNPDCDDCNENGVPDACDIAAELSEDANENGIPDECEFEMMMFGGGGSEEEFDADAAWTTFYEWYFEQDWSELGGAARFRAIAGKKIALGLPVTGS